MSESESYNREEESSSNRDQYDHEESEENQDQNTESEHSQSHSNEQSKSTQEFEYQHPEEELERSIIDQIHPTEVTGKFRDKICEDIEQKMLELEQDIQNKTEEEIIQIRTIQLAKAKILVMVHDWSSFRLVAAFTRLGIAYMDYDCYQQAEQHLINALKRNKQHFQQMEKCKIFNAHICTCLAKCFYQKHEYQMALDYLRKSRQIQINYQKEEISSLKTLMLMSNCYSKVKDFQNANKTIDDLIQLITNDIEGQSAELAMAYIEKAKIASLEGKYKDAENYQNRGIQSLIDINYKRPQFVGQAYQVLSEYQEKQGNIKQQINSLQKAKTICEQVFSPSDKRVIKLKRQISVILLKNQNPQDALKELGETLQLQKKVYGQNSNQVGKTLKLMGSIYLTMHMVEESKQYIRQAQKILGQKKSQKPLPQTKSKLRYVKQIRQNKKALPKSLSKKY